MNNACSQTKSCDVSIFAVLFTVQGCLNLARMKYTTEKFIILYSYITPGFVKKHVCKNVLL